MKIFTTIWLILSLFFSSFRYGFTPTIVFDADSSAAPISSRASGHLYGLAEANVPDRLMVESLDISSVSQKVIDGLQHPIGDIDHVAQNLGDADYLVVYLQDAFSTWYYENDSIIEMRKVGTYDWHEFMTDTYFPLVEEKVTALKNKPYADRLVYCLYNECDNAVWFGTWVEDGQWCAFDEEGRDNFFAGWKETFDLVRSMDPGAKIGGPGYYEYSTQKEYDFLKFCFENDCIPDIMIYHELSERSADDWDIHVEDYRRIETELGVGELPIIVTEYATMQDCGNPAAMFKYVYKIEETGTWGNIAYWRLADNLNDNSADGISPNAAWWLYRWYADMSGDRLEKDVRDLSHADFGKAVKEGRWTRNKHYNGFGAINETKDKISILVGDADYTGQIKIKNMDQTHIGKTARVKVESITFQGLGGAVYSPTLIFERDMKVLGGTLTVKINNMDENTVYHVEITPGTGEEAKKNDNIPVRFEFEHGTLLGASYTYDSAYATTGEVSGMVGGIENAGDGVALDITVPDSGLYNLDIIYGKHNDGAGAAGRVSAKATLSVNGEERDLTLENTVKSEFTSKIRVQAQLSKGKNTLSFGHVEGTYVLDSVLVSKHEENNEISVLFDADRSSAFGAAFLAVAPENGWYDLISDGKISAVDGGKTEGDTVYLRQGLNLVETEGGTYLKAYSIANEENTYTVTPADMTLADAAKVRNGALTGISSEGGSARFTLKAEKAGDYRVTFTYTNNAEGGYHAYNVDLIEEYVTVTVNGVSRNVWCRNTYSDENKRTVTFHVTLTAGENVFELSNDGAVRFDGRETDAPDIYEITVNPVAK